jgi:hypothetical protein
MLLTFAIAADAENLDDDECNKEYSHPDSDIQVRSPISNSETSSSKLERQYGQPTDGVVPADGKSPSRWSMMYGPQMLYFHLTYHAGSMNRTMYW